MVPSEVHVSYKKRRNIEVASTLAARETPLALVSEKHIQARTTRTTCPHPSSLEMSFAVLTAILTAARKRGNAAILRQTDDDGQTQQTGLTKPQYTPSGDVTSSRR